VAYNAANNAPHDDTLPTSDVVHETSPHQQCFFDFTPTWPARPAPTKHLQQLNAAWAVALIGIVRLTFALKYIIGGTMVFDRNTTSKC
jgi:hypothetical protein